MIRFIGASMTNGATRPSQRRLATRVWIFQWPKGALELSLSPLRQRPRSRVSLVVVPVSSRKISLLRSRRMMGWRPSFHSLRALAMSGLSCSDALSVFFEAEATGNQKARQRGRSHLDALGFAQQGGQLRHADVVLCLNLAQNEDPVRAELAMAEPASRFGVNPARLLEPFHQLDGKRHRRAKTLGSLIARVPGFHEFYDTLAQIGRQRVRHGYSPPHTLNHFKGDLGIPFRFQPTILCSSPGARWLTIVWGQFLESVQDALHVHEAAVLGLLQGL